MGSLFCRYIIPAFILGILVGILISNSDYYFGIDESRVTCYLNAVNVLRDANKKLEAASKRFEDADKKLLEAEEILDKVRQYLVANRLMHI